MPSHRNRALPALLVFMLACVARPQSPPTSPCSVDQLPIVTTGASIFTDAQEQDLGDAIAEYIESDMRIAPPAADDQITRIGERLVATLPPTGIHFRFRVYDSGEVNGFSLAGGRVYISRKLIAAVKTEDELAGVLAHEIGHIVTHQSAVDFTRLLKIRLGITHVTDRADIFARVHQLFSTPPKDNEPDTNEEKDQIVADRVALYSMVRAGYAPSSFASFLNDTMLNKGKTGNWFTDMFGLTHEAAKRYRGALKLISALPAGCQSRKPASSDAFGTWLRAMVEERIKTVAEGAAGDKPLKLDPPLRPSLWRVRFSPDGHYVLAQDEGSITVVDKEAAKVLFRIDAPEAQAAQFSTDSREILFHDSNLRIEHWSVPEGKRTIVKELVVYDGCRQTLLSRDGRTLVCTNIEFHEGVPRVRLRLIDVESGNAFYDKPSFFQMYNPSYFGVLLFALESLENDIGTMLLSPDGRYLLVVVEDQVLAYDLEQRQQISLGGKLKDLRQTRMAFLGPDQLFVVGEPKNKDLFHAQILSFPAGQMLKETEIGSQEIGSVTNGRLLTAGPLKGFAVGIFDPNQGKIIAAWKQPTIDLYGNTLAAETATGKLLIGDIGSKAAKSVDLPLGPLPEPRASAFSPDGKFLALSVRTRSQIWELETGKQIRIMRPLRSAWMDDKDSLFGQLPKYMEQEPAEVEITLEPQFSAKDLGKYEPQDWQYHDLQFRLKPMGKDKSKDHHATLEVKKMDTQTVVWSRDYPHEVPVCWPAEDDRMVLAWDMSNDTAKAEIKNYPQLRQEVDVLKDRKKGLLLETVAPLTGAPLQQVIIPEADQSRGRDDQRRAIISGDVVLARGEHGNTAIYSLANGSKIGEFFGLTVATDANAGVIAAQNREEEILIVDEHTGKELERFTLGSPVRAARIVNSAEKTLMVLTADQVVHRLPLPKTR
ncbi:MAG TPA: M48 family metalloprotease [Terracidiphilus sp.]|nr:M48 family metalloprotease [Terracidiphilus sp.]